MRQLFTPTVYQFTARDVSTTKPKLFIDSRSVAIFKSHELEPFYSCGNIPLETRNAPTFLVEA